MRFKSIAEFLALKGADAPTTAERKLIKDTQAGEDCYLCDEDPEKHSLPAAATDETRIRAPLVLQSLGYVITSLGLAAATGIIQRNQPD